MPSLQPTPLRAPHARFAYRHNGAAAGSDGTTLDVLSDVLDGLQLRSEVDPAQTRHGAWSMRTPEGPAGFCALLAGRAWLELAPGGEGAWLEAGDLAVATHGSGFVLASAPGAAASNGSAASNGAAGGTDASGERAVWISGRFHFDERGYDPLLGALPALLLVRAGEASDWLAPVLAMLERESRERRPGSQAAIHRLAHLLFVNAARSHAADASVRHAGWLGALMQSEVGPALGLLHLRPDVDWTVEGLAHEVGLSRSVFAARFVEIVGETPARYLCECRMHKAAALLRDGALRVKEIAARVGYGSEAAFGAAFKRWSGVAPGAYRYSGGKPASVPFGRTQRAESAS